MAVCPICVGHCFIYNNFKRISLNHGKVLSVNNIHQITVNREIFAPCFFSRFAVVICIRAVLISRFVKYEKNKLLIEFQTVKQLFLTTIGFQRRSHSHINVNEVSNNHLFDLKTM